MKGRKIICIAVMLLVVAFLLINKASASQIQVFAPLNYAGIPPSFPTPFASWGSWAIGGSAGINPANGGTSLGANPGAVGNGIALSWFDTGWTTFTGSTQTGSVHADTWISGSINAPNYASAGFRIYLWVVQQQSGQPLQFWQKSWSWAWPGSLNSVVDLGITTIDRSWPGNLQFQWVNGASYHVRVMIVAFASPNTTANCDAKYDDVLYITYLGSPDPHWITSADDPQIKAMPPLGSVGTEVKVEGTGFAPESSVYVYYNETLVNKTSSDASGNFKCSFKVPSTNRGPHTIRAIDQLENMGYDFFDVFIEKAPIVGDITGDGRVDMSDIYPECKNFGKTDPNSWPPPEVGGGAKEFSTSMSALASFATVSIGLFKLRKKHR